MKIVNKLTDIEPACLELEPSEEEEFSVAQEVTQDEASEFAFRVNQKRDGHVWLDVKVRAIANAPDLTTLIHARCSY